MKINLPKTKPIVMSSAFLYRRSVETNLRLIKEAGYENIELFLSRNVATRSFEDLYDAVEPTGLRVVSLHLPIPFSYNLQWPNLEESIGIGLKWADALGADWVISHPMVVQADADAELRAAIMSRYRRILSSARQMDGAHRLLIENMPKLGEGRPIRNLFTYPDGFVAMLREFGFGMAFDTTHWGSFDLDAAAGFRHFAEHVRNVHISDFSNGTEHIVPGEGDIDLDSFLDELRSSNYSGQVTLELDFTTSGRNEGRNEEGIVRDLIRCREWLEKALRP